ncbi:hypothetical protein LHGZ1_2400 [Laribacter hongkongensis]|uniref:Uncharacterized protein n=1 Tax=Laribacter hongkongensis TaxID=168471 RepID=A0A248LL82_9NEIS|nr:hypothetical protein LHGZ1_2400 [Laribacter hongkongensis]
MHGGILLWSFLLTLQCAGAGGSWRAEPDGDEATLPGRQKRRRFPARAG